MEDKHKTDASKHSDLRIVLLGKTGTGKSSAGNTIIGDFKFRSEKSPKSITNDCQKHVGTVESRNISVIDTPGLFDTNESMSEEKLKKSEEELKNSKEELKKSEEELKKSEEELKNSKEELKAKIMECVRMSLPGPHVFLLVMSLDAKYTAEEKNTVKWIQENFGEEATRYTIILFTRGDQLEGKALDDYISEDNNLKALVEEYHNRYHSFNNKDLKNRSQVTELLEKIKQMVKENGGQHYTNEMYEKAQKEVEWENLKKKVKDYGRIALQVGGAAIVGAGAGAVGGAGRAGQAAIAAGVAFIGTRF